MSDAPPAGDLLPAGYGELLEQIKTEVRSARLRATRAANTELIGLYWRVGRLILDRQAAAGWGAKVIERLADDLRRSTAVRCGGTRSAAGTPLLVIRMCSPAATRRSSSPLLFRSSR